jgi:hypothetical protein
MPTATASSLEANMPRPRPSRGRSRSAAASSTIRSSADGSPPHELRSQGGTYCADAVCVSLSRITRARSLSSRS